MHNHVNQKQFHTEHTPSANMPGLVTNTNQLSMDYLNPNIMKKRRKMSGLSEEKLSDTALFEESFMNIENNEGWRLNRSVSAPPDFQRTSYPLTVKNLASYNKQVTPFKGDYKTIVRRWLSKSLSAWWILSRFYTGLVAPFEIFKNGSKIDSNDCWLSLFLKVAHIRSYNS